MEKVIIRGVKYVKAHFEDLNFHKFKELVQFQNPYKDMKPVDRDKAMIEDWKILETKPKAKKDTTA